MSEGFYEDNGRRLSHSGFQIDWFKQHGIEPELILDVGAYDCGDSIRFARAFPNARIYSFEGCPGRNALIKTYIDEYPQIIHNPYAVSDKVGEIEWFSSACRNDVTPEDYGAQGSILKHTDLYRSNYGFIHQAKEPVKVQCITLSHMFARANVDLAHIDVEGAEIYVIRGFGELRPKLVYVETLFNGLGWEGGTNTAELHSLLTSMDYRLVQDFGTDRLYKHENKTG
jgi:FkbM family methyltransferase